MTCDSKINLFKTIVNPPQAQVTLAKNCCLFGFQLFEFERIHGEEKFE